MSVVENLVHILYVLMYCIFRCCIVRFFMSLDLELREIQHKISQPGLLSINLICFANNFISI